MGQSLLRVFPLGPEKRGEREGAIVGGLLLMGDERITPIIKEASARLPPLARIAAVKCELKQVFRAQVFLLLDLLERETDERVYASLAVALSNCAKQATKFGILDTERVLPVWKAPDELLGGEAQKPRELTVRLHHQRGWQRHSSRLIMGWSNRVPNSQLLLLWQSVAIVIPDVPF
jgi:hypothetical protein